MVVDGVDTDNIFEAIVVHFLVPTLPTVSLIAETRYMVNTMLWHRELIDSLPGRGLIYYGCELIRSPHTRRARHARRHQL